MSRKSEYEYKDLTKSQRECLSIVEGLGIYELRALARIFGDNSPTTLKRDEHIKIIMDKIISGEDLRPIPLRQGRPYKELSNINGILDELSSITGKDYSLQKTKFAPAPVKKDITFKQVEEDIVARQLFPIQAKGILCKNSNGDFFFYNQYNFKFVLVKREMCAKLSPYDFVEGTAILMNNNNEYLLQTIERINFESVDSYQANASSRKNGIQAQSVEFENTTLKLGTRYRIDNLTKFVDKKQKFASIVKALKKQGVITMAIIPNVPDEDLLDVQSLGFDSLILFKYNEKNDNTYQSVLSAIEFVKHQQELGKSLAVFVQDCVTLMNMIDYCVNGQPKVLMGHTEQTADTIKEFGGLVTAGENGNNTTCFVSCDNSDLFDPLYVSLIYKVYKPIEF